MAHVEPGKLPELAELTIPLPSSCRGTGACVGCLRFQSAGEIPLPPPGMCGERVINPKAYLVTGLICR